MSRPNPLPEPGRGPKGLTPAIVATVLLLLPYSPLAGQSPRERVLGFGENASGFSLLGEVQVGVLHAGGSAILPLGLRRSADYLIVGYCDACDNLDLTLTDSIDVEVAKDRLPDAEPILSFAPSASGIFRLEVAMVSCPEVTCRYAAGVFSRSAGGLVGPGAVVEADMASLRSELLAAGFSETGEEQDGFLNQDGRVRLSIDLEEGREYRIAGVCDEDCSDMDLVLRDSDDEVVDADRMNDPYPLLAYTPTEGGEHSVDVIMVECAIAPCAFRIATFAREAGLGSGLPVTTGAAATDTLIEASLGTAHDRLPGGTYVQRYSLQLQAEQSLVLDLTSTELDTYLIVESPDGNRSENDDYGGDAGHSHLALTAREDGTYTILVTTYEPGATGAYSLRIVVNPAG